MRHIKQVIYHKYVRKKVKKLFEDFEKLLQEHKTTIYRVSKDTGIPQTTLYEWKSGRSTPKVDKMIKIADYFNVPLERLIKGGEKLQEMS